MSRKAGANMPPAGSGDHVVFLLSARISGLWEEARPRADLKVLPFARHSARAHAICALRLLLLIPAAVCVMAAWLMATGLALAWAVFTAPFRRSGGTTAD